MSELANHKNLIAFKQHGFIYKGESGTQVYGYSVFSGKDNFWINPETKMWDCKNSGESGGYQQFLQRVHRMSIGYMHGERLAWLKKKRGFLRTTIKNHAVGFNPHNDTYLIPVYDANNENIWDLRIYNPKHKKLMSTSGCNVGLYGWDSLQKYKNIWLVEGEWDKMAIWEMLYKLDKLGDETVVAVPGVLTFKQEWCQLFVDKNIRVAYDADKPRMVNNVMKPGPGSVGSVKVYKILKSIAKSLKFVHWPNDSKDGYDVNDLLNETKSHERMNIKLISYLKSDPPIEERFLTEVLDENKTDAEVFTGKFIKPEDVYAAYTKWFYLPDTTVIDVLYGTIIGNRLSGDPLWLFLIAPSGGTKTEFCLSVSEAPRMFPMTTMTKNSLVSGANFGGNNDPSLIPLLNDKVLLIKDFTAILDMNHTQSEEIFGTLRDAYDGRIEKMFGNGLLRRYESKFGIVAGVTPKIEQFTQKNVAFGERFLSYKIPIPKDHKGRLKYLRIAMSNVNKEQTMRKELRELGTSVLSYNYVKNTVNIPESINEKIMIIAEWTASMRGTVERDPYSKEVVASPYIELATRLVKQYTKLIIGISLFRGKKSATRNEYTIVRDIAVSSVATELNKITELLYKTGVDKWLEYKEILNGTELPTENLRRKLENLVLLKAVIKKKEGLTQFYSIEPEIYALIKEGNIY